MDSYIGFCVDLEDNIINVESDNKYGLTPYWGSRLKHGDVVILNNRLNGQSCRLVYVLDYVYEGQERIDGQDLTKCFEELPTARGRLEAVYEALFDIKLEGEIRLMLDTYSH